MADILKAMQDMFDQIIAQEEDGWKRMVEYGKKHWEWRKKDPKRYEATMQAALETFGKIGDPVNPVIAAPWQVERFEKRIEQILTAEIWPEFDPSYEV